jgi:hypothetical protein
MFSAPQPSIEKPSNRFRSRSLRAAALAVSATAASTPLAREADAAIIYDLTTSYEEGDSFFLDVTAFSEIEIVAQTMGGMFDLFVEGPTGMGSTSTVEFAFFPSVGMMVVEYLDGLSVADTVDGSLTFTDVAYLVEDGSNNIDFPTSTPTYAGFVFNPTGSLPLYGWAQLELDASGTNVTISQWAFDDTGAPIEITINPEPTTSLLLGLGLMSLAVTARRGRTRDRRRPSPSSLPS